ncbi:MAG: hypothetical protein V7638_3821 [Acidobacteriota bacterium]
MPFVSIDATNAAIYQALHGSATLLTLAPGDAHDGQPEDGTPLPFVKFTHVASVPDYTFGLTVSSEKHIYMLTAHAERTDTKTARELCAQIVDLCKTLLLNAQLVITGAVTLACVPTNDIPTQDDPDSAQRSIDTGMAGFYFDVHASA